MFGRTRKKGVVWCVWTFSPLTLLYSVSFPLLRIPSSFSRQILLTSIVEGLKVATKQSNERSCPFFWATKNEIRWSILPTKLLPGARSPRLPMERLFYTHAPKNAMLLNKQIAEMCYMVTTVSAGKGEFTGMLCQWCTANVQQRLRRRACARSDTTTLQIRCTKSLAKASQRTEVLRYERAILFIICQQPGLS